MKNETEKTYTKADIFDEWYFNEKKKMTLEEYQNSSFEIVGIRVNEKNYFIGPDAKTLQDVIKLAGVSENHSYYYLWKLKKGTNTK